MVTICNAIADEFAVIYKMSFYDSSRHRISHTDMYYAEEKHTRWGHRSPLEDGCICKIYCILVSKNTHYYNSAISNSERMNKQEAESNELFDNMIKEKNEKKK